MPKWKKVAIFVAELAGFESRLTLKKIFLNFFNTFINFENFKHFEMFEKIEISTHLQPSLADCIQLEL